MKSIQPYTGEILKEWTNHQVDEVESILQTLHQNFLIHRKKSSADRCLFNLRLSSLLLEKKHELARLITTEMGKPIRESLAEIEKCALLCKHYSQEDSLQNADILIKTEAYQSRVYFEPMGIIFAIMPWNFPFWQVFRFVVPCITAGNTIILKHAPNVIGCAIAIEKIFSAAGDDLIVLRSVILPAERSVEIISHPFVPGISLTGSEKAGRSVASLAGQYLKKVVLELGGSDPYIVFEDAQIDQCCRIGVRSRMLNAGQVCIAAKRFLVQKSVFQEFTKSFIEETRRLKCGDPLDPDTDIGPLARPDLVEEIEKKVNESVAKGAKILLGGKRNPNHPQMYEPTLLIDIQDDMPVFSEETFGPVAVILPFDTEEEAIRIANNTRFGLGASIWTQDIERAQRIGSQIETGSIFINSMVKSDPRLPFGGTKNSGYGRELTTFGALEFMHIKTEWIENEN